MSLFQKAAEKEQPKTTASKSKLVVPIAVGQKLKDLTDTRQEMASLKAKEATLVGDIKPIALKKFFEIYKEKKVRPESFIIQSEGTNMMFIPQDKYTTVTTEKEIVLRSVLGDKADEVIGKTTEYKFDDEMLEKYGDKISEAIMNLDIPEEDKEKIIKAETKVAVKKGTIDRLLTFDNPENLLALIDVVSQLKNSR